MKLQHFIIASFCVLIRVYTNAQCSAPTISNFSPLSAATGTTITINGSNFDATPANNIVYFGAAKAVALTASANQLTVKVPLGATFNYLTVTNTSCNLTGYSSQFFNPISVCSGTFSASTVDARIDYSSPDAIRGPYAILFGDFDLDGKTDVIYPIVFGSSVGLALARNQSVPGLIDLSSQITLVTGEVRNCTIADFDMDGKLDIIYVSNSTSQVLVIRNTSSGPGNFTFASPISLSTNSGPYQVSANDIDGDGKPDIAIGHFGGNAAVFRNTSNPGTISFAAKQDVSIDGYSVALADLDGDKKVDLLTGQGALRVCQNTSTVGAISFAAVQTFTGGAFGYRIAVGDLNGDDKNDVVASESNVGVYRNTTSGGVLSFTFSTINTGGVGGHRVSISDLNGDGLPDIMATYTGSNQVACALNTTSAVGGAITFGANPIILTGTGCQYALGTADIDGDGNNDVLAGDWCTSRKLSVFRNNVLGLIPVTNSVSQTAGLVCNSTITINYSAQCSGANPGNVYTAQLSDANGSFAVPINIGSVTSTTSGTITANIPSCIATGSGYKVRVVGSDPAVTGTIFITPLSINCQTITPASISTSTISPTTYCPGAAISVTYIASGSFGVCAANTFTAQLSDAAGSFASPVNIGSLVSNASGTISATIPSTIPNGSSYRIRVVSDQPQLAGTNNGSNITISSLNCIQLNCPANVEVPTGAGTCTAVINGIDPIISPTGSAVNYNLSGATTSSGSGTASGLTFNLGVTNVTYTAASDASKTCNFTVTVANNIPVINSITGPTDPVAINSPINLSVAYTDNNVTKATINWGDGTPVQTVNNPTSSFTTPHTYTSPGVYTVKVKITDACGAASDEYEYQYVVVYDPSSGFVTGGGWINSPEGAYTADLLLTGKAQFGFVSKYEKGKSVPSGNTQFQFHAADMNFKSTNYEWLVISGSKAQFKGVGTINDEGNYGFLLSGVDGNLNSPLTPDRFRIKIWDRATSAIVYDNQIGAADDAVASTDIGGGSIVVHAGKASRSSANSNLITGNIQEQNIANKFLITALPNPSLNYFTLISQSDNQQPISVKVMDILGKVVEVKQNINANSTLTIGHQYRPGVYMMEVIQGKERQILRLVKVSD